MPGAGILGPIFMLVLLMLGTGIVINTLLGRDRAVVPRAISPESSYREVATEDRQPLPWSSEELLNVTLGLAHALGLEIRGTYELDEVYGSFIADDPRPLVGGRFAFRSVRVREGELVDATDIISFHDEYKVENIKKGIVLTNGYFSEEAVFQGEDRPMELLNRQELLAWATEFAIKIPEQHADQSAQTTDTA